MKLPNPIPICLLVGLATAELAVSASSSGSSSSRSARSFSTFSSHHSSQHQRSSNLRAPTQATNVQDTPHSRLLDSCCRIGSERALESQHLNCKMSATEALSFKSRLGSIGSELLLVQEPEFGEQCELVLESCCIGEHRRRNCNSGKQFAKSGSACMDVELSKDVTIATESFNDCCMSCSLGILAAKTSKQQQQGNESMVLIDRCKLMTPLASSLSGQLYEQTYIECCQENLPKQSGALTEPGQPIDCARSNPCSQKCVQSNRAGHQDRCDCFVGYKLSPDGINCIDIDECKLNLHSCNRKSELCDNVPGGFRCLARGHLKEELTSSSPISWSPSILDSNPPAESQWDQQLTGNAQQFVSLRLCPLNSRWNSQELRCEPTNSDHQLRSRVISNQ